MLSDRILRLTISCDSRFFEVDTLRIVVENIFQLFWAKYIQFF